MSPEIKERWIAALTSGAYEQGRFIPYNPWTMRHCVLGVLDAVVHGKTLCDRRTVEAQTAFYKELGLDEDIARRLMRMNDGGGHDFHSLAAYIEEHVTVEKKETRDSRKAKYLGFNYEVSSTNMVEV